jgi:hypothetical protein
VKRAEFGESAGIERVYDFLECRVVAHLRGERLQPVVRLGREGPRAEDDVPHQGAAVEQGSPSFTRSYASPERGR